MSMPHDPEILAEVEAAKLRALAEFAAGAGHEINNPLATIVGYVQQLLANETDPDRRHALSTIGGQALRIRDMIGDVMLFARPPIPKPESIDLSAALHEVATKFAPEAKVAGVRFDIGDAGTVPIVADPTQVRVAISAVLRNSLEATPPGGTTSCIALSLEDAANAWGVLRVRDTGRGLTALDREHVFDPFYSGRQAGRGLGFGLSKAWRIVTMHGGRIEVASPDDGGTQFTLLWPTATRADLSETT